MQSVTSPKATVSYMSVCPSFRIYQRGSHSTDIRKILWWVSLENLSRNYGFCYNRAETSGTLHVKLRASHSVSSDVCSTTMQRTHRCVSLAKPSLFVTLLTVAYLCQQEKGNAFLRLHGNNGYTTSHNIVCTYTGFLVNIKSLRLAAKLVSVI